MMPAAWAAASAPAICARVLQHVGDRRPPRGELVAERLTVDELHRHEFSAVVGADIVDGDDIGMIQRRGGACFVQQSTPGVSVLERSRGDHFMATSRPSRVSRAT